MSRKWTSQELSELHILLTARKKYKEIGALLNRTAKAIEHKVYQLRYPDKAKRQRRMYYNKNRQKLLKQFSERYRKKNSERIANILKHKLRIAEDPNYKLLSKLGLIELEPAELDIDVNEISFESLEE